MTHYRTPDVTRRSITSSITAPTARYLRSIYKSTPRQEKGTYTQTSSKGFLFILLYFTLLYSKKSFIHWLWHRRCCGRHHTGVHPWGLKNLLCLTNVTDDLTHHQFGAVCGDDIFVFKLEKVVSDQLFFLDGAQSRFCGPSLANSGSCSHSGRID